MGWQPEGILFFSRRKNQVKPGDWVEVHQRLFDSEGNQIAYWPFYKVASVQRDGSVWLEDDGGWEWVAPIKPEHYTRVSS